MKREIDPKKILIPGVIGNILEWYDFLLYAFFTPLISKLFFPKEDKTAALLAAFGIFAAGFLIRPLGSIIFGHFGDRFGRKITLITTVSLMAIATAGMGFVPSFSHIGIYAVILLTICRLVQGLAVGGEFGYVVYLIEHAPPEKRGLYGSFTLLGAFAGALLASFAATLTTNLSSEITINWSWRIPFILGLVLGIVGLYIRLRLPETPLFSTLQQEGKTVRNPLRHAFKIAPLAILQAIGLAFLPSISAYIFLFYLSSYLTTYHNFPLNTALLINTLGMVLVIPTIPLIGYLSDKVGRKPVLIAAGLAIAILSYPLFLILNSTSFIVVLLLQILAAFLVCLVSTPLPVTLVELVPTQIRYTAMGLSYNTANAIFGGTAPMVVIFLIQVTDNILAPSFYLIGGGLVLILITLLTKESYKSSLI